jgi:membrane fusion protein, multidrug efflux system
MKKLLIIVPVAVLLWACGGSTANTEIAVLLAEKDSLTTIYRDAGKRLKEIEKELEGLNGDKKLTLVSTVAVNQGTFSHYFDVHGVVEANKNAQLFAETPGVIKKIFVQKGQKVSAGQLLLEIDSEIIEKNIAEVQTSLELATELYNRQEKLWKEKIGSEVQYLEAKNRKEGLENSLRTLQAQKEKAKVRAPFAGVIDEVFPKEGEMAGMQMPLFRLVNMDKVYVKCDISESYVMTIKQGTDVEVYFPSFGQTVKAKISRTGQYINPNNRTFQVEVDLMNLTQTIKPNLLATVKIKDFEQENALIIPSRLLQQSTDGRDFVYVARAENNEVKVHKVFVLAGMSHDDHTMIIEGLEAGDMLVDRGSRSIKDGQAVRINNEI